MAPVLDRPAVVVWAAAYSGTAWVGLPGLGVPAVRHRPRPVSAPAPAVSVARVRAVPVPVAPGLVDSGVHPAVLAAVLVGLDVPAVSVRAAVPAAAAV